MVDNVVAGVENLDLNKPEKAWFLIILVVFLSDVIIIYFTYE